MRISAILIILMAVGCTKHNPDSCCTTAPQCSTFGLDGIVGCEANKVCDLSGSCIAPECTTSADCTTANAPICEGQLCVAKCTTDDECVGVSGRPYCAIDGACVACKDDLQCSASAPVCDGLDHACRKCVADADCASGVCLESVGTCSAEAETVFVMAGGMDAGNCEKSAPCSTIGYAINKATPQRNVIYVLGASFNVGPNAVDLSNFSGFIDGSAIVTRNGQGAVFTTSFHTITLSGLTIGTAGSSNQSVTVTGGAINVYGGQLLAAATVASGSLAVEKSLLDAGAQCTSGTLLVNTSDVHRTVTTQDCTVTISQNHFDSAFKLLQLGGVGIATVENNTLVSANPLNDGLSVFGSSGSVFRFNTVVNVSGMNMTSNPLDCGTTVATSNIMAWHTSNPPNCAMRYTLFDSVVGLQSGTGNKTGDETQFFVNLANKDLRLSPSSLAIGGAEPSVQVDVDIDGLPRPQPAGTPADMGAYESN